VHAPQKALRPLSSVVDRALSNRRDLWRILHATLALFLALFLSYQLWQMGWDALRAALPTAPSFYFLFTLYYLAIPIGEFAVFRLLWQPDDSSGLFVALLRKRIYSQCVIDYSGEVYLYTWARQHLPRPAAFVRSTIKDSAVVSAVVSTTCAVLALAALVQLGFVRWSALGSRMGLAAFACGALALTLILWFFRRRILLYDDAHLMRVAALHAARLLGVHAILLLLWHCGAPQLPLHSWCILLVLYIAINRIPLLPHRDLLLLSASLQFADALQTATAVLAGTLLTISALEKGVSLVLALNLPRGKAHRDGAL
jgi:hypothetical protein